MSTCSSSCTHQCALLQQRIDELQARLVARRETQIVQRSLPATAARVRAALAAYAPDLPTPQQTPTRSVLSPHSAIRNAFARTAAGDDSPPKMSTSAPRRALFADTLETVHNASNDTSATSEQPKKPHNVTVWLSDVVGLPQYQKLFRDEHLSFVVVQVDHTEKCLLIYNNRTHLFFSAADQ